MWGQEGLAGNWGALRSSWSRMRFGFFIVTTTNMRLFFIINPGLINPWLCITTQWYWILQLSQQPRPVMRDQSKKAKRDPIVQNFENLVESVTKYQLKNSQKYSQVLTLNPSFVYSLHHAAIPTYETREQLSKATQTLLQEIDKLMEDEQKLNLELDRHQHKLREEERKIEKEIMLNMDHFTFLRRLWRKDEGQVSGEAKLDKLIHNVGAIKGHILNTIKKQTHLTTGSAPEIRELVLSSPEYVNLLRKYEELREQHSKFKIEAGEAGEQGYYTKNLEQEVKDMREQLQAKDQQLQQLKSTLNNKEPSLRNRRVSYAIASSDGSYQIQIQQPLSGTDREQQPLPPSAPKQPKDKAKLMTSRHSLDSILKFIEQSKKPGTVGKQEPQPEGVTRKFTVEQIAKPRFISQRGVSGLGRNGDDGA